MSNLKLYELGRRVPAEAKKTITAGRLKNFTDINPMFRIKRLTEMFGPCGVGWWYEITDKRIAVDDISKQSAAFVDIVLYYVDPESGVASHGIPGTGGSSFVAQEKSGPYMSDECFKMALTDAISVSCKALGIGADVYWEKDRTKYDAAGERAESAPVKQDILCDVCGQKISPVVKKNGETWAASDMATYSSRRYGRPLCAACMKQAERNTKNADEN